jgi:hypothetical protein
VSVGAGSFAGHGERGLGLRTAEQEAHTLHAASTQRSYLCGPDWVSQIHDHLKNLMGSMLSKKLFFAVSLLVLTANLNAEAGQVIIRPAETQELLVNPGMGITTFQRYNGDALNPSFKWSEEGPTTIAVPPAAKPEFPETSIAYCRWYWSVLEPQHGQYRWHILDLALDQARLHQQTLAIRIMPYDSEHPLPEWYRQSAAKRANKPSDADGEVWQPDFGDSLYLKYWGELVAAAGARYDGHTCLDSVDVSLVGGLLGRGMEPLYA